MKVRARCYVNRITHDVNMLVLESKRIDCPSPENNEETIWEYIQRVYEFEEEGDSVLVYVEVDIDEV